MSHSLIALIVLIFTCILFISIGLHIERKNFNNGICPKCGGQLELFDIDSHGERGYKCGSCEKYQTWVSYHTVDWKK